MYAMCLQSRLCSVRSMLVLALLLPAALANAQSQNVTYQGHLTSGGAAYSGAIDCRFGIWDSASGGHELENETVENVSVTDGLFTATISLSADTFQTTGVWMEVSVHPTGSGGSFTVLTPRQPLTAAPFALQSRGLFVGQREFRVREVANTDPEWGGLIAFGGIGIGSVTGTNRQMTLFTDGAGGNPVFTVASTTDSANWFSRFAVTQDGRVGIGTGSPTEALQVSGNILCRALLLDAGADLSEGFAIGESPVPGTVVVIDPDCAGALRVACDPYDAKVAGIVSGAGGVNPGVVMGQKGSIADGEHPVALTGRVYCWVDADANGPVNPGDMLTTSSTPGHAMRVTDRDRAFGATIGKAMTSLESGRGLVLVLVDLH